MQKKGLSNVIATVLIVLLALAAITIVWQFTQRSITNSGTNYAANVEFTSLRLSVVENSLQYNEGAGTISFSVERLSGGDELDGIKVIFTDSAGNTAEYNDQTQLAVLERIAIGPITYTGPPYNLVDVVKIDVYGVIIEEGGSIDNPDDSTVSSTPLATQSIGSQTANNNPPPAPVCGDGNLDAGEECDGSNYATNYATCQEYAEFFGPSFATSYSGSMGCNSPTSCTVDTTGCTVTVPVRGCRAVNICQQGTVLAEITMNEYLTGDFESWPHECDVATQTIDCATVCGNGVVESGESCDDGNTANGDGCDSNCQSELGLPGGTT